MVLLAFVHAQISIISDVQASEGKEKVYFHGESCELSESRGDFSA